MESNYGKYVIVSINYFILIQASLLSTIRSIAKGTSLTSSVHLRTEVF